MSKKQLPREFLMDCSAEMRLWAQHIYCVILPSVFKGAATRCAVREAEYQMDGACIHVHMVLNFDVNTICMHTASICRALPAPMAALINQSNKDAILVLVFATFKTCAQLI